LPSIPGTVPSLRALPAGCRFHPRCKLARVDCSRVVPPLLAVGPERQVRCPYFEELE
jgi:oligopeptide transport system ATP-binding protein